MGNIAFIFPGQGAQETGMGMDIVGAGSDKLIAAANEALDFDLMDLISNPQAPINETSYTQPALVAVSMALHKAFVEASGIKPVAVAGLSLGEYSAHVAAGNIDYMDAIQLVRKRGLLMEEAGKTSKGAMAAIIKGDQEIINDYCLNDQGIVVVANYNSPVQVVISGEEDAVTRVSEKLSADGTRVIPLSVSGAFHSPLMESAARVFAQVLDKVIIADITDSRMTEIGQGIESLGQAIKVYSNVTGQVIGESQDVKGLLVDQLKGSVLWQACIENMLADGIDTFIEIGPGKTLAGLIKKINRKIKVYNVNSLEAVKTVAKELAESNLA